MDAFLSLFDSPDPAGQGWTPRNQRSWVQETRSHPGIYCAKPRGRKQGAATGEVTFRAANQSRSLSPQKSNKVQERILPSVEEHKHYTNDQWYMGPPEPEPEFQRQLVSPRTAYYMTMPLYRKEQHDEPLKTKDPKEHDLVLQKSSFDLYQQDLYKQATEPKVVKEPVSKEPWQYQARGLHGSLNGELRDIQHDVDDLTRELKALKAQVKLH